MPDLVFAGLYVVDLRYVLTDGFKPLSALMAAKAVRFWIVLDCAANRDAGNDKGSLFFIIEDMPANNDSAIRHF